MQAIKRFGRSRNGSEKSEGDFRTEEIIIDCLWNADDIDASFDKRRSATHCAISADDNQRIDLVLANRFDTSRRDI